MNVLITTPNLEKHGGVANYFATLKKYFSVSVNYFIIGARTSGEGILASLKRFIKDNWNFHKKLRENNYDIVHLNPSLGWKAVLRDGILLLIAKNLKHKVIVFLRGWNKECESRLTGFRLKMFKSVYFRADAIIVLAKEFQRKLRSWGYTGPIYIETTAVDDEVVKDFEVNKRIVQQRKHINFLYLARVEKAKGIYEAIQAYCLLKGKYRSLRLTVAGDGSELKAVKEYVKSNNVRAVEFAGYVRGKDKSKVFADADIYLFPTHGEGFPQSVLEAMACGLPIITRPVGGIKDFFEDGIMGFITVSKAPEVFANLMEKLINDCYGRKKIARYNQQYAREHFMASKIASRIEEIYRSVLSTGFSLANSRKS